LSGGGLAATVRSAALLVDPHPLLLPVPAHDDCPLFLLLLAAAVLADLAKLNAASSSLLPEEQHADSHSLATMCVADFAF
jgi:hypothetical protein